MLPLNSVMPVIYNYDDSEGTFDFEQNVRSTDMP
jgi:hypothetical protein